MELSGTAEGSEALVYNMSRAQGREFKSRFSPRENWVINLALNGRIDKFTLKTDSFLSIHALIQLGN